MLTETNHYGLRIRRGHSLANDNIFDFLLKRIDTSNFIDIGCNHAVLQRELGCGMGVDADREIIEENIADGLDCKFASAYELPFRDGRFDLAIISCVLQQLEDPFKAIKEARRVARRVIGVTPYPGKSQWGVVGGNEWVKSVIDAEELINMGFNIEQLDNIHYFFDDNRNKCN